MTKWRAEDLNMADAAQLNVAEMDRILNGGA